MDQDKAIFDKLFAAALIARENASAPYSNFKVGAAVMTENGDVFSGCNVESSSYGLSMCAERNAVSNAVSKGARKFKAILIVADTEKPVSPCGACRQIIYDYAPDIKVIMSNLKKESIEEDITSLLKYPFGFEKKVKIGENHV